MTSPGVILEALFSELADRWLDAAPTRQAVLDERLRRELALPQNTPTRICFFSIPRSLLPQYKETVFPLAEDEGLVPTAGDDAVAAGGNVVSVIASLLARAAVVVVDLARDDYRTRSELLSASSRPNPPRMAVIVEGDVQVPQLTLERFYVIRRGEEITTDLDATPDWVRALSVWLADQAPATHAAIEEEPLRLLNSAMYRPAVVAAVTALEIELRDALERRGIVAGPYKAGRTGLSTAPLAVLMDSAALSGILSPEDLPELHKIRRTRDRLVHSDSSIDGRTARPMVERILRVIEQIRAPDYRPG